MRKLLRLMALLAAVLLALTGCGWRAEQDGLLVEHQVTFQPPPPPQVTLLYAGDLMLTRTPGDYILKGEDPFAGVASVLAGADVTVGNLECAVSTLGKAVPKRWNFRCSPKMAPVVATGFTAVSVANNHAGDFGKDAFAEMLDLLKQSGVKYLGGGKNAAEAHAPLIIEKGGYRFALLGYDEVEYESYKAGPHEPGLAWSGDDAQVVADIQAARTKYKADFVIPYMHWGIEYKAGPSDRQRALAHKMIDAGADVVIGGHPHVTEGVEVYKGHVIVYALGNFVFDDFKDVSAELNEPARTSWMARLTFDKGGLVKWDTVVTRTDDRGFPQPLHGTSSPCGDRQAEGIRMCKTP